MGIYCLSRQHARHHSVLLLRNMVEQVGHVGLVTVQSIGSLARDTNLVVRTGLELADLVCDVGK